MRYFFLILPVATGLLLAGGCSGPPPDPVVAEVPGYEALREQFTGLDMSPLQRRRIVLDPGHGGYFKGAVGPSGLTEAEVNLGVSLYLRGLLEWAGAEVFMTRTADYDFLTPADSTLTSDLAFRTSFANSMQPDVFLSLHHNSVASLDRTVNETQTYYPLNDDGASLDLARAIHRHLVLNLEISPAKILPGNFHVLRNATVPAVLGEPAMISHPVIEGRLSLAASQRLEAEAYFLGLLDYFSQGAPRWGKAPVDTLYISQDDEIKPFNWHFSPEPYALTRRLARGPVADPETFSLTLDGKDVPFHISFHGWGVRWYPTNPLPNLPAVMELRGRNVKGRAAPVHRIVLMPASGITVQLEVITEASGKNGEIFSAVRWSVPDHAPLPRGEIIFGPDRVLPLEGGISGAALLPDLSDISGEVVFRSGSSDSLSLPCLITHNILPEPWKWRQMTGDFSPPAGPWSYRGGLPRSAPSWMADPKYPLIPYDSSLNIWVTVPGMLPLVDVTILKPDFARTVRVSDRQWALTPIAPALRGKVIVLDPAGGGSNTNGTGPLGTRGSTLNLETALLAKSLLEGCGAEVHLTRPGETSLPAEDKVRLAGITGADLFLTIGRSNQTGLWTASHHPGSDTGNRWAELFLKSALGLTAPDDSMAVFPSYNYLLRHTACPALEVLLPGPATTPRELLLSDRGWQRAEARAVLMSIVSLLAGGENPAPTLDVAAVIANLPGAPKPEDVFWAELDGNLNWSPVPSIPALEGLSPGTADSLSSFQDPGLPDLLDRHTLEIHADQEWQLWLLEKSDTGYSARKMVFNP